MKVNDINEVLIKMQSMTIEDEEYSFYWGLVEEQYRKMIIKLIGNRDNREDLYNDCVLEIPKTINDWIPEKAQFSTFLTIRLRALIQNLLDENKLVFLNTRYEKHYHNKLKKKRNENTLTSKTYSEAYDQRKSNEVDIFGQLSYEQYIDKIKHLKYFEMWKEHFIDEITLFELGKKYNMSYVTIFYNVRKTNEEIEIILNPLIDKPRGYKKKKKQTTKEVIEKVKLYKKTPEQKEYQKEYQRKVRLTPEWKEKQRAYQLNYYHKKTKESPERLEARRKSQLDYYYKKKNKNKPSKD